MSRRSPRALVALGLALAVGLAFALSPYASSSPDGLNRVAAEKGFADRAAPASIQAEAPMPGYAFPGVGEERLARGVAGFGGTLAVFAIASGIALVLRRRARRERAL